MRHPNIFIVRLALIIGGCIAVCEWDRPDTVKYPTLTATYLQKNPSILAQYVPQEDFTPTIRIPIRWMMVNGEPSGALRAALYLLYVDGVPGASIVAESDIFNIGHFALASNAYTDPTFEQHQQNLATEFSNWWTKNVPKTPQQGEMEVEPETPVDLRDDTYVLNETPTVSSLWN